jgi:hypothetical protein
MRAPQGTHGCPSEPSSLHGSGRRGVKHGGLDYSKTRYAASEGEAHTNHGEQGGCTGNDVTHTHVDTAHAHSGRTIVQD